MIDLNLLAELFQNAVRDAQHRVQKMQASDTTPEKLGLLAVYDRGYEDGFQRAIEMRDYEGN